MLDEITFPPSPHDRRPRCVTEEVDRARAAVLRALARRFRWATPNAARYWAEPLALLRRGLGDSDLVGAVLDWYVGWYAPGKRPEIRNGREFRERWSWLEKLYNDAQAAKAPAALPPAARWVLSELAALPWPPRAAEQLPAAVAKSHAALVAFAGRLAAAPPRICHLGREVLGTSHEAYLHDWFKSVWRRYGRWAEWSGDLGPSVWSPRHPEFVKAARAASEAYAGTPDLWTPPEELLDG